MNPKELSVRISVLIIGMLILSLGVAVSILGGLGTTPIACVPYVISLGLTYFTVGEWTILFHTFLVIGQFILLKSNFDYKQIFQIPLVFIFGYAIDFWVWLLSSFTPTDYITQWIFCIAGVVIISFGIIFEVKADLILLAPDGFVLAICKITDREFGPTKPYFDVSMVIIGVVLSFLFLNQLAGIREGTVFAALCIGYIAKFFKDLMGQKSDNFFENFTEE